MLRVNGKLGLRQRSRMTHEESRGKAYIEGNGKLGLRCIDCGKKQDLGQPRSPGGRLTLRVNGKLGLSV